MHPQRNFILKLFSSFLYILKYHYNISQFGSVAQSCPTLWPHGLACHAPLCITNSQSSLRLMSMTYFIISMESVMTSSHLILCCPLLLLPSNFLSIRVFSNESALHIRWPKYWSFSFSISPSNEHSRVTSFKINWLDLLFYLFIYFYFTLFYFTILYWFCHTSAWIHHGCTWVPNPEPPSHLPPHTISLGHPSAPAPSILYPALNLDLWFVSYMILYMFQCHSPKSSHPLPLPQSPKVCSIHLCLFCCLTYCFVFYNLFLIGI